MKKVFPLLLILALVLSVGTVSALAASSPRDAAETGDSVYDKATDTAASVAGQACGNGVCFTDADGDGVCDNRAGAQHGNGTCDGSGFTDADGDGVCGNRVGTQSGHGHGRTECRN